MKEEKIDLNDFLKEMIESFNEKFKACEESILELKTEIERIKGQNEIQIDKSVLNVLKGK